MSTQQAITTTASSPTPMRAPLSEDLQEMSALGSFMFLLNELQLLAVSEDEKHSTGDGDDDDGDDDDGDDENTTGEKNSSFEPIMRYPLLPATIHKVVEENADVLIEKQGEKRHQAHLQMFEFLENRDKGDQHGQNDEEAQQRHHGPVFLDYNEEKGEDAHLVYSLVLDHRKRRITIVFRGSVTKEDWNANFDSFHTTVDNPLYDADSDCDNKHDGIKQPKKITLHRGFYEYVHKPINGGDDNDNGESSSSSAKPKTRIEEIVEKTLALLEANQGYEVFTTGVSLGGALTAVFAFFAAACYPSLGPITCYSYASPKVGTLSFRLALQHLETTRRLLVARIVNWADPVIVLPREPLCIIPCDAVVSTLFFGVRQAAIYRHIGMRIFLHSQATRHFGHSVEIAHAKIQFNFCRVFLSDLGKLWGRLIILLCHCVCFIGTFQENYRANHGYPEYWYRVKTHASKFQDMTLRGLYEEFFTGDRTHVKTRFM